MASVNDKLITMVPLWSGTVGSGGVANGTDTTIPLASASGLTEGSIYVITIDRVDSAGTKTLTKREVVIGKVSGDSLIDCLRGQEGTAQAHSAGAVVEVLFTAKQWNRLVEGFVVEHSGTGVHTKKTVTAYAPAGAGTTTIDLSLGNINIITMPAATQTLAISNESVGQCFIVEINNVTSQGALTWFDTVRWVDGTVPTLTGINGKRDVFGFRVTGTDTYDGYIVGQNI